MGVDDESGHDGGERALHPGDDDDAIRRLERRAMLEHAVDAGDPHVGDPARRGSPAASSEIAASSATGRSDVPAATTAIGRVDRVGPADFTTTSRARSWNAQPGTASATAAA